MRKSKYILVDGLPRFIAEAVGFCVRGIKHLPFFQHRASVKPFYAIFFCEVFVKPKSVIRPYLVFFFQLFAALHALAAHLPCRFPWRSPLRLRKSDKKSARQLHATRLKSNDRFGLNVVRSTVIFTLYIIY